MYIYIYCAAHPAEVQSGAACPSVTLMRAAPVYFSSLYYFYTVVDFVASYDSVDLFT